MKQVLHKLETSGRLMKWAIELSEFDIRYTPKTAIKGQVLVDSQATPDLPIWKLSVDEAANAQGPPGGSGILMGLALLLLVFLVDTISN